MTKITPKVAHVNVKFGNEKQTELEIIINEHKRKTIITVKHGEIVIRYRPP